MRDIFVSNLYLYINLIFYMHCVGINILDRIFAASLFLVFLNNMMPASSFALIVGNLRDFFSILLSHTILRVFEMSHM